MVGFILSCLGGFVKCEQGPLLHHSPFVKELLEAVTCLCTAPVLILPDITVEVVCLALNLLVGSSGQEVTLEEELEPAATFFSAIGISFSYSINKIQVSNFVNQNILNFIIILKIPLPPDTCGGGAV